MSWYFSLFVGQLWEYFSAASMNVLQLPLLSHSRCPASNAASARGGLSICSVLKHVTVAFYASLYHEKTHGACTVSIPESSIQFLILKVSGIGWSFSRPLRVSCCVSSLHLIKTVPYVSIVFFQDLGTRLERLNWQKGLDTPDMLCFYWLSQQNKQNETESSLVHFKWSSTQ